MAAHVQDPLPLSPVAAVSSVEEAVIDALRQDILNLRLAPGTRLRMATVAESLGVSMTPVRQSLRRLEVEGLVVSEPRLGSRVAPLTAQDGEVVVTICGALERRLIGLGVPNLGDDDVTEIRRLARERDEALGRSDEEALVDTSLAIRDLVYQRAGRPALYHQAGEWRQRQERYLRYARHNIPGSGERFGVEFVTFIDACAARDTGGAQDAMQRIETALYVWLLEMFPPDDPASIQTP